MIPGKLNLLSRWPGEGLGGVVALDGLDDVGKGAGEEGVEDVVEDGLLLESRWFMVGGCSCRIRDTGSGWDCHCPARLPPTPLAGTLPSPGKSEEVSPGYPDVFRSNI